MERIKRYFGWLFLGATLIAALVSAGCASRGRVYDPYYRDYHRWDRREDRAYRHWEAERRERYRAYRRHNQEEQREYWRWRHEHREDRH